VADRFGACTGDFIWAFYVFCRRGSVTPPIAISRGLAFVSVAPLLFLAGRFAWARGKSTARIALSSFNHLRMSGAADFTQTIYRVDEPMEHRFWLVVIGSQPTQSARVRQSLAIARPWLSVP